MFSNLQNKQFDCHGSANVDGNLSADEVYIHGEAVIKGGCDAEQFQARGEFSVGGLLNAGTIQIKLFGHCQAKEIGGERIEVKQPGRTWLKKLLFPVGLTAESIGNLFRAYERKSSQRQPGDDRSWMRH
ncbi:hypothetical protein [Parageobacillus toebii]|uniref:Polymer-forming cytoskeletal protein n=1 Tax=Parageobacillus toebii NBRC 107807 TaxID=1223503 RepID=A0AA89NPT8_9BACL|nr:hypothetical protein [Parageobacillus toebii]MBB3867788.1 hypothetical protein [Parageobacillus toebii NBRC 107807]